MFYFPIGITIACYLLCFIITNFIVPRCIGSVNPNFEKEVGKSALDTGMIIGKCENFIIVTFILLNAITGLALIFTAKSLVRSEKMKEKSEFYLLGTMVNFTFSVLIGILLKMTLKNYFADFILINL